MLLFTNLVRMHYMYTSIKFYLWSFLEIFNKKTDEWYIEWQQVTTSDNDWYNKWQQMTTNDNEWQRVTTSGKTSDKEWQLVAKSDNKWQWVTASESSGTVNENGTLYSNNGWLPSFQWQKEIHYYFKGWMVKKVINK